MIKHPAPKQPSTPKTPKPIRKTMTGSKLATLAVGAS